MKFFLFNNLLQDTIRLEKHKNYLKKEQVASYSINFG